MHELSLCEEILKIAAEQAARQGFDQVKTVYLELGALSCARPEALTFNFEVASRRTLAEGAQLAITTVPGRCAGCGGPVTARLGRCEGCGTDLLRAAGGDELRIRELEVI